MYSLTGGRRRGAPTLSYCAIKLQGGSDRMPQCGACGHVMVDQIALFCGKCGNKVSRMEVFSHI